MVGAQISGIDSRFAAEPGASDGEVIEPHRRQFSWSFSTPVSHEFDFGQVEDAVYCSPMYSVCLCSSRLSTTSMR